MSGPPDEGAVSGRVSSRAVEDATGRSWSGWFEVLDRGGAVGWDHKGIVAHLAHEHPETTAWWRQSIAVAYEQARGKRVVGETAGAGFEVGVQRTVAAPAADVWSLLVGRPEVWLGQGAEVDAEGASYEVRAEAGRMGAKGVVRVVRPGHRLRLTWQPDGWEAPATLQVTLTPSSPGRTTVGVHLEKLPGAQAREDMRDHWRAVLRDLPRHLTARDANVQ